jgi:hypothetical protein
VEVLESGPSSIGEFRESTEACAKLGSDCESMKTWALRLVLASYPDKRVIINSHLRKNVRNLTAVLCRCNSFPITATR